MTIEDIFGTTAYQTEVTARLLSFDENDQPIHKDTILTFDNLKAFECYSINAVVPTGKYKLMIELA